MSVYLSTRSRIDRMQLGKLHFSYSYLKNAPKNVRRNLEYRKYMLEFGDTSLTNACALRRMCEDDILFWFSTFVWTYDPRCNPSAVPFIPYNFQCEAIDEVLSVWGKKDILLTKSRDMGASWILLAIFKYMADFRIGQSMLMLSRNEDYVDKKGNMKALFQRVDFIHKYTPLFLRGNIERSMMHYRNFDTGSVIDGESTTGEAASGDRRTAVLVDELSKMPINHQQKILPSTRDVTKCRIFNFTAYGAGSPAHDLSLSSNIHKIMLHWSRHPKKNAGLYFSNGKSVVRLDKDSAYPAGYPFVCDGRLRSIPYDDEERRTLIAEEMRQEWDCEFINEGSQFFGQEVDEQKKKYACNAVSRCIIQSINPMSPTLIPSRDGEFFCWLNLEHGRPPEDDYVVGVDVSTGNMASNSAAIVINGRGEVVGSFVDPNLSPDKFAKPVVALCNLFRKNEREPALLIWEANGPGVVFGNAVYYDIGYRAVWFRREEDTVRKRYRDALGWSSGRELKRQMLGEFRRAITEGECIVRDINVLNDAQGYRYLPGGAIEHMGSITARDAAGALANHGDRLIACGLAWWAVKNKTRQNVRSSERIIPGCMAWMRKQKEFVDRLTAARKERWR